MADNTPAKQKRRVKNPETFREKAVKASEAKAAPSRGKRVLKATGGGVKKASSPFGRILKKIFNRQPFRFIGKVLVPPYFRKSWQELKLVKWPTWPESRRLTFAVLVFAIIFGVAVAAVDYVLDKVFKAILIN